MKLLCLKFCLFLAFLSPALAQLPGSQEQYWAQVDEQMRQQEQQRWAQEMNEQARMWAEQQAYDQQAWDQEQEAGRYEQDYQQDYQQPDPMSLSLQQSAAMAGASQDLLLDPKFAELSRGFWNYHSLDGQYRSAMFVNTDGMISVHGPGGSYEGALLMLWGPNIPAPASLSEIAVALQQNDEPEQKVTALNFGFPSVPGWGTLIFVVPSAETLIANMEDVLNFKATVDGKLVFSSGWHDGKAASANL